MQGVPVLVVEDDTSSAKLLFVLLTEEGYDVRVARSAEEALAILPAFQPHVIVLDLVLPKMSGLLLAQRLKEDPSTRGIVVIAASSLNGPGTERLVEEAGCAAYVQKPIHTKTFAALVAQHLRPSARTGEV